jgi:hypothetical protein
MSDNSYLVWFLATALMTITVLTISTLAAAGMLPKKNRHGASPAHVAVARSSVQHRDRDQSGPRRDAA